MTELLKVDNIIGAKDTRSNYYLLWQLKQLNGGDINVINGPDESLLCGLTMGADGGIGATYGAMPEIFVGIYNAFKAGDLAKARELQYQANRIIVAMLKFGSSIRSLKEILKINGFDAGNACYPATLFDDESRAKLIDELKAADYKFLK